MFVRDETKKGHPVIDQIKPECQWVLDGEGVATVKKDGTNLKVEGGQLFKRQKPKDAEYDEASYVPCRRDDPADRWAWQAFELASAERTEVFERELNGMVEYPLPPEDGIYELVGPKVQGGVEGYAQHTLIRVVPIDVYRLLIAGPVPRTFDNIRAYLERTVMEGIVFHHPDGRMAKIKRRDFGLPWPVK